MIAFSNMMNDKNLFPTISCQSISYKSISYKSISYKSISYKSISRHIISYNIISYDTITARFSSRPHDCLTFSCKETVPITFHKRMAK